MTPSLLAAPADGYLATIAAHGLAGSLLDLPPAPLDPAPWRQLLGTVRYERITGLLAKAVEEGALPVTPEQEADAVEAALGGAARDLRLEQLLLRVAGILGAAGVPFRVLKGPALAHTVYPDPALRSFGDIDLLVPGERFPEAHAALVDAGGTRRYPEPRPGFDRRFGKGASYLMAGGLEVDVHRTLVAGSFGLTLDPARLFEGTATFQLAGRSLPVLGREEQFVNACLHTALGNARPRLSSTRDVAQLLLHGGVDDARALALASAWQVDGVIAAAVASTWATLGLADKVPLSTWAARYTPTRRDAEQLARYTGRSRNTVAQTIEAVRVVRGLRAKAAYLYAVVLPERTARGDGTLSRWRRGVRALRAKGRPE